MDRTCVSRHHDACDDHVGIGDGIERGGSLSLYIYSSVEGEEGAKSLSTNTYSLYQIATFDVETLTTTTGEGEDATTTTSTVYTNVVVKSAYANDFSIDTVSAYSDNSAAMKTLAATLKTDSASDTALVTGITDGKVTGLVSGYYMLVETSHSSNDAYIATDIILVAVDGTDDADSGSYNTVTLKETNATVEKKIVLENSSTNVTNASATGSPVDDDVVAIGDTITYQLTSTIPNYPANAEDITYTLTDTLSTGLTYGSVSSIVITPTSGEAVTYTPGGETNNCSSWIDATGATSSGGGSFTITVPSATVLANGGATVTVTFTATLNSSASVGATGNPNSVKLTYTNNWDKDSTYTTPEDSVITYTGSLTIKKVDSSDDSKTLSGATFAIYASKDYADTTAPEGTDSTITVGADENGEGGTTYYYLKTVTTGTDGTATIDGLDAGTYYAVETDAPDGYSLDSTPQELVLSVSTNTISSLEQSGSVVTTSGNDNTASGNTVTWKVNSNTNTTETIENTKGTTLPGTGGIGTTLFTFGGLALVIIAAVMFIVYTKKQRKQA